MGAEMEPFVIALVLALFAGFMVLAYALLRRRDKDGDREHSLQLLQNQLSELTRAMDAKLSESNRMFREQFGASSRLIREITQELTKVTEGQKQVVDVTEQLKLLQDVLKNPKQRGVLGEYYLETVLKNVLPPSAYEMQHAFRDGTVVDAVVITKEGIIPVDSKFSLENYNRILEASDKTERERYENAFYVDLKSRIDETAKYIKPEEGTLDFAFMFIPSEAVYYDLLVNKVGAVKSNTVSLVEYAAGKKKVMIVSPTTFLAYLQTVLQGLKALQIEEAAKKIGERVSDLMRHLTSYEDYIEKVGAHLGTTVNMYNRASREFRKIDKDILKITGETMGAEPLMVEGPEGDEQLS